MESIELRFGFSGHIAVPSLEICDCGLADYRKTLHLQQQLCQQRRENAIPDTILLVEHTPVITLGARQARNRLIVSKEYLRQKGIDVVNVRRGGGATAHNPGQLVIYPILNLQQLGLGISDYIHALEAIGGVLLRQLGVSSSQRRGLPGLWVGERKIASIGVRVSRMTTYHGMAINIQNDLAIFDLIVPCGLENIKMTSVLEETGRCCSINQAKENLTRLLREHFSAASQ
jgi:lipoate-protein ligase B